MPRPGEKSRIIISVFLAFTILLLDVLSISYVTVSIAHVLPVVIALRTMGGKGGYIMAAIVTILIIAGGFLSPVDESLGIITINRGLSIMVVWLTAFLGLRLYLARSELDAVTNTIVYGIISTNEKGLIHSVNNHVEQMFGYTKDELVGQNISLLVPHPHKDQHTGYIEDYLKTGISRIIGYGRRLKAQHRNGEIIPVHITVTEIRNDNRSIFTGIIRNLTAEQEKEVQLTQLSSVVDQCPVSIIITDTSGNIEYVNPYFCSLTGYEPQEVLGQHSRILKSGDTPSEAYHELWQTITRGEIWRGVLQNRKKDDELFWESATICPVYDHERQISHYVGIKENITSLREKDLILTRAMKMEAVGRMTDGIAHDFNNLLTIVLGNLQLLKEDLKTGRSPKKFLIDDSLSAAHDGSELIKRLLTFSRTQELHSKPVNINMVLEDLKRLLKSTIPADIKLKFHFCDDIHAVLTDENRLESAILNLVVNARDAMPEGGEMTITSSNLLISEPLVVIGGEIAVGNYACITVKDTGVGMTGEIIKHVLEPFYTTKATGTGLGLSMIYDFINDFNGGLEIESEPGNGTSITILLPTSDTQYDFSVTSDVKSENLPTGDETILLVEDREMLRRSASRILDNLGYTVVEADNGNTALEHLQTNTNIHLLFSDIIMPGEMNGRQLARIARNTWPELPILLTTGMEPAPEDNDESTTEFALLPKPYTVKQLALSIRDALDAVD